MRPFLLGFLLIGVMGGAGHLEAQPTGAQPTGARGPFDRWDANRDRCLTRDELPGHLQKRFAQLDPERFAVWGTSAGGHLAAMAGVTSGDPPMLLVHGSTDLVVPHGQSVLLSERLRKAGGEAPLITVEGAGHGTGFGPAVEAALLAFLGHHLLGEGDPPKPGGIPAGM